MPDANTQRLADMLAAQIPTEPLNAAPADLSGFGRGPTGKLRNFRAMNDGKLLVTWAQVKAENDDPEAVEAIMEQLLQRGLDA